MATLSTNGGRAIIGGLGPQIFVGVESGLTVVAPGTPLTRLNYYDGKFLRADDLDVEQTYFRQLTWLSNVAGGSGVVYGFDVEQAGGDAISLSPGLAIDGAGHVLLLPQGVTLDVQQLIDTTERLRTTLIARRSIGIGEFSDCIAESAATPGGLTVAESSGYYLITIAPAEALCGEDYVYGTLCEEACATSVQRPRRLDGIAVRAWPFDATLPDSRAVTMAPVHLRSRLASARFADEATAFGSLLAGADLKTTVWCHGACPSGQQEVALAVLARSGATIEFVDEWTARRELIETPPRRYWAGRMSMRPLAVFLAQILQFQCQLRDVYPPAAQLPRFVIDSALTDRLVAAADVESVRATLTDAGIRHVAFQPPPSRVLINLGIVELPAAGYLPVDLGAPVNDQVRKLLGEGVNLTFCVCRPDYVPHALEEAQHMDRIPLLAGLDDPANKQDVEILVPDGEIVRTAPKQDGMGWEGFVQLLPELEAASLAAADAGATAGMSVSTRPPTTGFSIHGAGRSDVLPAGGGRFSFAGTSEVQRFTKLTDFAHGLASVVTKPADVKNLRVVAESRVDEAIAPAATAGRIYSLVAPVLNRARTYMTDLRAEEIVGARAAGTHFQPQLPQGTHVVGMWVTTSCDRDPFSLRPDESTAFQLTADIVIPGGDSSILLAYQLRGDFRLDRILPVLGSGRRVAGTLTGIFNGSQKIGANRPTKQCGVINREATIMLSEQSNAAPVLDVSIPATTARGIGYDVSVTWDGSPVRATADVRLIHGDQANSIPLGTFVANPDVLQSGNEVNTLARAALTIVGAALGNPTFVDTAEALLFPPPAVPEVELTVKPRRNWVLFRRPRVKTCAPDLVVAPPPAKRYDVFEIPVGARDLPLLRAELWKDAPDVSSWEPRHVDRVEFAGGQAMLNTASATVQSDWQNVQQDKTATVRYAAIADAGAGEGDLLAKSRLAALEKTLAPVQGFDRAAVAEAVPHVPTDRARQGADGVILIATEPVPVAETCMSVITMLRQSDPAIKIMDGDKAEIARLIPVIAQGVPSPDVAKKELVVFLGPAVFDVEKTDLKNGDSLGQTWEQLALLKVVTGEALVLTWPGGPEADLASLVEDRVKPLAAALGGDPDKTEVSIRTIPDKLSDDCPAVAIMFTDELLQ
jgi:hypothetical protein